MIRILTLTLTLFTGLAAQAEDGCRGRCLLVDASQTSLDLLAKWPRPGLKMLLVEDYEMVEGTTVDEMNKECAARTHLKATETNQTLLVAYATYYTFSGQSAIIDYVPLKSCDSQL